MHIVVRLNIDTSYLGFRASENLRIPGFTAPANRVMVSGMRLRPEERETIKAVVARRDPQARVYLFGSRTDSAARGGDLDLLIDSATLGRPDVRQLRLNLQDCLGAQHFDLVLLGPRPSAFARAVATEAVAL
jgi:predicted nucleotidyltransferase